MDNNTTTMVEMTPEQLRQFEAFQKQQAEQERQEQLKKTRDTYNSMVDDEIEKAVKFLQNLSEDIRTAKDTVLGNFKTLIEMRKEIDTEHKASKSKSGEKKSLVFTHKEGSKRIIIGFYVNDDYLASAETGVEMAKSWIESQSTDERSQMLVSIVLDLLAKDKKGTLNAQNILQLKRKAYEFQTQGVDVTTLLEGVRIIEEAYSPTRSKTFVRCYTRDEKNDGWKSVPLGMTES